VRLVGLTGEALTRIVGHVDQMSGLMSEIASAAQEQATGLGQVNSAVNQMDKVTQQNAAMVEQSTAASHSLAGEAEELMRLVKQFRTGVGQSSRISPGVPSKAASVPRSVADRPAVDRPRPAPPRETVSLTKRPAPAQSQEENWSEF
jgi:methyl-accepting chemotaxis protein